MENHIWTVKHFHPEATHTTSAHIPLDKAHYIPNSKDVGKYKATICLGEENQNIHVNVPNDYTEAEGNCLPQGHTPFPYLVTHHCRCIKARALTRTQDNSEEQS